MKGTLNLVRFILRRERVISTIWVLSLSLFSIGLAVGVGDMFDFDARMELVEMLRNPAMVAMAGPVYGVDNFTVGAMFSVLMLLWTGLAVGTMNILLVVRHTRADEERGRAEVVRSLPTGRLANLNATIVTAVIVNIVLALITGLGIGAMGIESMDMGGAILYGAVLGAVGLFFAAVTALFCQLSQSSRGATGYSFLTLGVLYMVRAAGDAGGNEVLACLSALGLSQRVQAFIENNWWPVILILLQAVVIAVIAYVLNSRRDLDQGFIPAKPGRADAKKSFSTAFSLAFKLSKNVLIIWLIIFFCLGASYGSVLGDIDSFIETSEFYQMVVGVGRVIGFTNEELFAVMVNSLAALVCLVPLINVALKTRGEESEGRAEHILTRSVSRHKYLASYAIIAFVSAALFQITTAIGLYASASQVLENPDLLSLGFLLQANIVYTPALWVMIGGAILLVGLFPKATSAIWVYFAFTFFASFVGRMLELPKWLTVITPFDHVPQLPMEDINYLTMTVLTLIAAGLTAAGFYFYRKRDMLTT